MTRDRWGFLLVLALGAAALGPAVFQPLAGDDIYVMENLRSRRWHDRLFAFNLDAPTPDYTAWWERSDFQRRFLRVPSSALLWVEWKTFGFNAEAYHVVTLVLTLVGAWLARGLAMRWVSARVATFAVLVPAVHPALAEVVGQLNCQPLVTAGVFALVAATAWEHARRTGARRSWGAAFVSCALAMTSYEAAIVLPVVLGALDFMHGRRGWPLWGLTGLFALYAPFAWWIRRNLSNPDTGPMRPLAEVWRAGRLDATTYVLKTFGVFDPMWPTRYWLHSRIGEGGGDLRSGSVVGDDGVGASRAAVGAGVSQRAPPLHRALGP